MHLRNQMAKSDSSAVFSLPSFSFPSLASLASLSSSREIAFDDWSAIFFGGKSEDRGRRYVTESKVQLPSQAMVLPNSDEIV